MASKPKMMHDWRTAVHEGLIEISDAGLKQETISMPSADLNLVNIDEEDETVGHYDRTIAAAIAWQLRSMAMPGYVGEVKDPDIEEKSFDKFASFNEL
jgi:hypothetical protein